LNKTPSEDLVIRLYANDVTPAESDTEADYTEATGGGYVDGTAEVNDDNVLELSTFEFVASGGVDVDGTADIDNTDIDNIKILDEEYIVGVYLNANDLVIEEAYSTEEILALDDEFLLNYQLFEHSDFVKKDESQTILQFVEECILLYDMNDEKRSVVLEETLNTIQIKNIKSANDIENEIFALYELL